jgi:hypothetical protein
VPAPPALAQGTLGWGAGPTGGNGTITVTNGTYGADSGWTAGNVLVLAQKPGDSVVYSNGPNGSPINNGQWSATINNVPNGNYTVWASLQVTKPGVQPVYITAGVANNVPVGGNIPPTPAEGSLTVTAGPTVGPGTVNYTGTYTVPLVQGSGWQFAPGGKPLAVNLIPTGGGQILVNGPVPPPPSPWDITVNAPNGGNYHAIVIGAIYKPGTNPPPSQIIGTPITQVNVGPKPGGTR